MCGSIISRSSSARPLKTSSSSGSASVSWNVIGMRRSADCLSVVEKVFVADWSTPAPAGRPVRVPGVRELLNER